MYNFKEKNLSRDFCKQKVLEAKELIYSSVPFTVLGMPTMGISFFLKYLACQKFAYFIHVDINELPSLNKAELLKLILKELGGSATGKDHTKLLDLCKAKLSNLVKTNVRVVILFNRFDRLQEGFDQNFFANLRALWEADKEKVILVFTANKPLPEIAPKAVSGGNLNLVAKNLYLTPYKDCDLKELIILNSPNLMLNKNRFQKALKLSGGHYQLLILLLKSDWLLENPLDDPAVKLQLSELFEFLNYKQRKQLQRIVEGKANLLVESYLQKAGVVSKDGRIFSPLFAEFIQTTIRLKLGEKEEKIFKLLKQNKEKLVTKDEIFAKVWEDSEDATDWALDSLIYRLRKNPHFSSQYEIENYKGRGYRMVRI